MANKRKNNANMNKLCHEEQQAIGAIYQQYIDTFEHNNRLSTKTFIKSGFLFPSDNNKNEEMGGEIYNPKPIVQCLNNEQRERLPQTTMIKKRGALRDTKSNLKSLGDELKMLQHERQSTLQGVQLEPKVEPPVPSSLFANPCETPFPAALEVGDEYTNSTNLFISSLGPLTTELHLVEIFGKFGPLASVKIMWPRGDEPHNIRGTNCGFVAFMSRIDAERALVQLKSRIDMRVNWGKSVKIPQHPVYIPPKLFELYAPPPQSGLPFNAQVIDQSYGDELDMTVVKVVIPHDRNLLALIHRMVEFVCREGPLFEAMILRNEYENPDFAFLTDFQSPAHTYYRWKLFSVLQGESQDQWSLKPFRLYRGGSIWLPPIIPDYTAGMPEKLLTDMPERKPAHLLTEAQRTRLIDLIRNLTIGRAPIRDAMVFCLNHEVAIDDAMAILLDSFFSSRNPVKKIARLYLLGDVVVNCRRKFIATEKLRNLNVLMEIFKRLHEDYDNLSPHYNDRDIFKTKILKVLRSWIFFALFDFAFVTKLENIFLFGNENGDDEDDDNSSLNDEPLDGANLLKRSLFQEAEECKIVKKRKKYVIK